MAVAVSLEQYGAVGVPDLSPATWMRGTALARYWIDIDRVDRLLLDAT